MPRSLARLAAQAQRPLPHHPLSRAAGWLTRCGAPWVRRPLIAWFVRHYGVDLAEAAEPDPGAYPSFQAFFTRALRPGARPLCPDPGGLACPADGTLSDFGRLSGAGALEAKDATFGVEALLGGEPDRAAPFRDGHYVTVYLSPRDYHRVHMPRDGRLREMVHIPGRAFSVGPATTAHIPGLFARNERVAALFDTDEGPMAVVLVGAMLVATIATAWAGTITPPTVSRPRTWTYPGQGPGRVALARGDELGRFNLGSTVIVVLGGRAPAWAADLARGMPVAMGRCLERRDRDPVLDGPSGDGLTY